MSEYLVTWAIEVDADNPRDAARQALEIQRDQHRVALHGGEPR